MDALAFEEPLLGSRHEDAKRRMLAANCLMLTLLTPDLAIAHTHGKGTAAEKRRVASCIHQAARDKPWLEKTLSALRDQEGGWIGAAVRNTDGSYDLGPMQINSQWITPMARLLNKPTVHVRRWLQHDACFNVQAARWLFLSGLAASSDYWTAVGSYHSPTRWRQRRYAIAVSQRLERRSGK